MLREMIQDKSIVKSRLVRMLYDDALFASSIAHSTKYKVGAVLFTVARNIYLGCNVINQSYGLTMCAERVAVYNAIVNEEKDYHFIVIAVTLEGKQLKFMPCGACLQVLHEFCGHKNEDFLVIVGDSKDNLQAYTLKELLPNAFELPK